MALFSTSRDSFEEHASTSWGSLLDLRTGEVRLLTNGRNVSEIVWLGPTDPGVLYINAANADIPGGVELWVSDVTDFANAYVPPTGNSRFSAVLTSRTGTRRAACPLPCPD